MQTVRELGLMNAYKAIHGSFKPRVHSDIKSTGGVFCLADKRTGEGDGSVGAAMNCDAANSKPDADHITYISLAPKAAEANGGGALPRMGHAQSDWVSV